VDPHAVTLTPPQGTTTSPAARHHGHGWDRAAISAQKTADVHSWAACRGRLRPKGGRAPMTAANLKVKDELFPKAHRKVTRRKHPSRESVPHTTRLRT